MQYHAFDVMRRCRTAEEEDIAMRRQNEQNDNSPLGVRHTCQHVAVGDLVIVQEALVLLVHLARLQLACELSRKKQTYSSATHTH